jgi:hypothetical protein
MQWAGALFPWEDPSSKGVLLGKKRRLVLLSFLKLEPAQCAERKQQPQGREGHKRASGTTALLSQEDFRNLSQEPLPLATAGPTQSPRL